MEDLTTLYGYCECNCGEKTAIRGGKPQRFRRGHQARKYPHGWTVIDMGHSTSCWIWNGAKSPQGYAYALRNPNRERLEHRAQWVKANGRPIPDGGLIHHLCEQKSCVNPEHLALKLNTADHLRHHAKKLTLEKAREIRDALAEGETGFSVARRFGVSTAEISLIRQGKHWREDNTVAVEHRRNLHAEFAANPSMIGDAADIPYTAQDRGHSTPCWIADKRPNANGYVVLPWHEYDGGPKHRGTRIGAHRLMYIRTKGAIPVGLHLHHLCNVTNCINPDHLEPVTRSKNNQARRSTRLNPEKVRAIRASTERAGVLAERYEVTTNTVYAVRTRRVWTDVE